MKRHFELQGDTVVEINQNPDLLWVQGENCAPGTELRKSIEDRTSATIVGGTSYLPVELTNLSRSNSNETHFFVSKWFNGNLDSPQWSDQTLVGLPLNYLQAGDLGPKQCVGHAMQFVESGPLLELFSDELFQCLENAKHCGFVTLELSLERDGYSILSLHTGLPEFAFFNIMESIRGKASDFLCGIDSTLHESWTVSLVLSVFPWPVGGTLDRMFLTGVTREVRKHLWLFDVEEYHGSMFTYQPLLGIATAWSHTLVEASRRALRTLRSVNVKDKQYRIDSNSVLGDRWGELVNQGLVL